MTKKDISPQNQSRVFEALDAIKKQTPGLEEILKQFQINQAEYNQAMMTLLASQLEPQNTYATDENYYA